MSDNTELLKQAFEKSKIHQEPQVASGELEVDYKKEPAPRGRPSREKLLKESRGARIPLYDQAISKFKADVSPGCQARFVNDDFPGKIAKYELAGWRIKAEDGLPITRIVNRSGTKAYLMETDKDIFNEDKKRKQLRRIDRLKEISKPKKEKPTDDNPYYGQLKINLGDEK
jgi:hypothetical protein